MSSAVLSFFTGASNMPVTAATPVPSPSPSPTPVPSPVPGAPIALAPGELTIVRSTVALAPSDAMLAQVFLRTPVLQKPIALPLCLLSLMAFPSVLPEPPRDSTLSAATACRSTS